MTFYTEITKKKSVKPDPVVYEERLKKMRKDSEKTVKGMFEFIDAQGGWLEFTYRIFPGEPIGKYRLVHGQIYEIPMGVVKHLNNTKKKIRKFAMSAPGEASELTGRGIPSSFEVQSRVRFTSTDLM